MLDFSKIMYQYLTFNCYSGEFCHKIDMKRYTL